MNLKFWKKKAATNDSEDSSPEQPADRDESRHPTDSKTPKNVTSAQQKLIARTDKRLDIWAGQLDTLVAQMGPKLDTLAQRFKKKTASASKENEIQAIVNSGDPAPTPALPEIVREKTASNVPDIKPAAALATTEGKFKVTARPEKTQLAHHATHKYTPVELPDAGTPVTHGLLERMELKRSALKLAREKRQLIEAELLPISPENKSVTPPPSIPTPENDTEAPTAIEKTPAPPLQSSLIERMELKRSALKLARERRQATEASLAADSPAIDIAPPVSPVADSSIAPEPAVTAETGSTDKKALKQAALKLARENRKRLAAGLEPLPDPNAATESESTDERSNQPEISAARAARAHFDFSRFSPDQDDTDKVSTPAPAQPVSSRPETSILESPQPESAEAVSARVELSASAVPEAEHFVIESPDLEKQPSPGLIKRLDQQLDMWAERLDSLIAAVAQRLKKRPAPIKNDDPTQPTNSGLKARIDDRLDIWAEKLNGMIAALTRRNKVSDTTIADDAVADDTPAIPDTSFKEAASPVPETTTGTDATNLEGPETDAPERFILLKKFRSRFASLIHGREKPVHIVLLGIFLLEIGYIAWDNIRFDFTPEKISVGIIKGPIESHLTQDTKKAPLIKTEAELHALRKKNEELQAQLEALENQQAAQPSAESRIANTENNESPAPISGEVAIGSKDPKANAMTLKQAIEAMNAASGDYEKNSTPK